MKATQFFVLLFLICYTHAQCVAGSHGTISATNATISAYYSFTSTLSAPSDAVYDATGTAYFTVQVPFVQPGQIGPYFFAATGTAVEMVLVKISSSGSLLSATQVTNGCVISKVRLAMDSANNLYYAFVNTVTCTFFGATLTVGGASTGEVFFVKTNSANVVLAQKRTVSTTANSYDYLHIAVGSNLNVYFTAYISATGTATSTLDSVSVTAYPANFFATIDSNNVLRFVNETFHYSGGDLVTVTRAIGTKLYIGIRAANTAFALLKLDQQSVQLEWKVVAFGTSTSGEAGSVLDVAVDSSGSVYFTGFYSSNVQLNGRLYATPGISRAFVAKYSASGTQQWFRDFGDSINSKGLKIAINGQNVDVIIEHSSSLVLSPVITLLADPSMSLVSYARFDAASGATLVGHRILGDTVSLRGISYSDQLVKLLYSFLGNGPSQIQSIVVPQVSGNTTMTLFTLSPACTQCYAGSYSSATNASNILGCIPCVAGTYSGVVGATSQSTCNSCPIGTASAASGKTLATTCVSCPSGTFANTTGSKLCTPCLPGTFTGAVGTDACTACPFGMKSGQVGATSSSSCTHCPKGEYTIPSFKNLVPFSVQTEAHVATSSNGEVYIGASVAGTATFGGSTINGDPSGTSFVIKYNPNGSFAWAKSVGPTSAVSIVAVTVDKSDNLLVSLTFTQANTDAACASADTTGNNMCGIALLRNNSDCMWLRTFVASQITGVQSDSSKNYYFTIETKTSSVINGISINPINSTVYLIKANGTGMAMSVTRFLEYDAGQSFAPRLVIDNASKFLLCTSFRSRISLFNQTVSGTSQGVTDMLIVKFDAGLNQVVWQRTLISPLSKQLTGCVVDSSNSLYVAGSFMGDSLSIGTNVLTSTNANFFDSLLIKYDANGNVVFVNQGVSQENDEISAIRIDKFDNVYAAGVYSGALSIAGASVSTVNVQDIFVLKITKEGTTSYLATFGDLNQESVINIAITQYGNGLLFGRSEGLISFDGAFIGSAAIGQTSWQLNLDIACAKCPSGTYLDTDTGVNVQSCISCPLGTTSTVVGATSLSQCLSCPAGTYNDVLRSSSCTPCAAGKFSSAVGAMSASTCAFCLPGQFSAAGATSCTLCNPGFYSHPFGVSCIPCDAGTYNTQQGSASRASCTACPSGSYSNIVNATSATTCVLCDAGKYSSAQGATSIATCVNCPTGTYSIATGAGSIAACLPCPAGTFVNTTGNNNPNNCIKCKAGYFSPNIGQGSNATCQACPRGTFQATEGATTSVQCVECLSGTYGPSSGLGSCVGCPEGTFGVKRAATLLSDCQLCTPGTYNDVAGSSSCKSCAAGSYATNSSTVTCTLCPPGTYSTSAGSTSLSACTKCPVGTYSASSGATSRSACISCAPGYFTLVEGATTNTSCEICRAGSYCFNGAIVPCPNGTYSSVQGLSAQGQCTPCPKARYNPNTGADSVDKCLTCPKGTFNALQGAALCTPCDPKSYNDAPGQEACKPCPVESVCVYGSALPFALNAAPNTTESVKDPYIAQKAADASANAQVTNTARITIISIIAGIAAVIVGICILVVIIVLLIEAKQGFQLQTVRTIFKFLDFFTVNHPVPLDSPLMNKQTIAGGIISIVYIFGIILVFALLLVDLIKNNTNTKSSIVPEHVLPVPKRDVYGNYNVSLILRNYFGDCTPSSSSIKGFAPIGNISSSGIAEGCVIYINCTNCTLLGITQSISLSWKNPLAMASSISYEVLLPHFNINELPFNVTETITPASQDLVFRGESPTEVTLSLLKAYQTVLADDYLLGNIFSRATPASLTRVGFVANKFPSTVGSTVSPAQFPLSKQEISFNLVFSITPNVLQIVDEAKLSILGFISQVFALIGAVGAVCILVMGNLENLIQTIADKLQKKKPEQQPPNTIEMKSVEESAKPTADAAN